MAGAGAGRAVLRLVDGSLLVPPRVDPDGRTRYPMLETLRAYAARLLAEAGEDGEAAAALSAYAANVATESASGLDAGTTELASLRRLDAEDATMSRALAWAMDHDPGTALRLALALRPWWQIRGRLTEPGTAAGRGRRVRRPRQRRVVRRPPVPRPGRRAVRRGGRGA